MKIYLVLTALIGLSISGSHLAGGTLDRIGANASLNEPPQEVAFVETIPVAIESYIEEDVEIYGEEEYEEVYIEEVVAEPESAIAPVVEEIVPEPELAESVPTLDPSVNAPLIVEPETEESLTYDQLHQRDVADEEEPVPPEVSDTWFVEETANLGLEIILSKYSIPTFDFFIVTTLSNYVYQYDFYIDSPDGGHVNLLGIYQYDATGQNTFHLNPITGVWE